MDGLAQRRSAYLIKVVTRVFVLAADGVGGDLGEVPLGARFLRQPWAGGAAGSVVQQQRCPGAAAEPPVSATTPTACCHQGSNAGTTSLLKTGLSSNVGTTLLLFMINSG